MKTCVSSLCESELHHLPDLSLESQPSILKQQACNYYGSDQRCRVGSSAAGPRADPSFHSINFLVPLIAGLLEDIKWSDLIRSSSVDVYFHGCVTRRFTNEDFIRRTFIEAYRVHKFAP